MNKKTIVIFAVVVVIVVICFIGISQKNKTTKTQSGTEVTQESENKMLEIKKIEGYEIFNANMSTEKEITNFKACIRNTSEEIKEDKYFEINFLDDKEEILGKITVHIEKLDPNSITEISGSIWGNMQDAKDYTVVEK